MPEPTTGDLAAGDLTAAERAAAELEAGRHLFAQNCRFIAGAATLPAIMARRESLVLRVRVAMTGLQ